jgi:hypothetical protein
MALNQNNRRLQTSRNMACSRCRTLTSWELCLLSLLLSTWSCRVSDQWVEGQCYWDTNTLEIFGEIRNYATTKLYSWILRTSTLCGQMRQKPALSITNPEACAQMALLLALSEASAQIVTLSTASSLLTTINGQLFTTSFITLTLKCQRSNVKDSTVIISYTKSFYRHILSKLYRASYFYISLILLRTLATFCY